MSLPEVVSWLAKLSPGSRVGAVVATVGAGVGAYMGTTEANPAQSQASAATRSPAKEMKAKLELGPPDQSAGMRV
jgi:hypothetical protein